MAGLPSLKGREVITALQRAGFVESRTSGSHHILKKSPHSVSVPMHGSKPIKRGTLGNIIKQAGMTVEEFMKYL
jgi:predicted RNA binding protein YcfA (HicA-like mRNA interferase family)